MQSAEYQSAHVFLLRSAHTSRHNDTIPGNHNKPCFSRVAQEKNTPGAKVFKIKEFILKGFILKSIFIKQNLLARTG